MTDLPDEFELEGVQPAPSTEHLYLLEDLNGFVSLAASLLAKGVRQLRIYHPNLDLALFGDSTLVDAISAFARRDRNSRVQLLVQDPIPLIEQSHPLVRLQQRLTDKIGLRALPKDFDPDNINKLQRAYMVCDDSGLLVQHAADAWQGFVHFDDRPNAREFAHHFDSLWKHGEAIIHLQRLGL